MKIEEKIREVIESEMKKYEFWEVNEKENARRLAPALVELFESYARSLVPKEEMPPVGIGDKGIYLTKGWNACRREMLRRIEEE